MRSARAAILLCTVLGWSAPLAHAQSWQPNDGVFNPSGIPSLFFSQPRFADLDADGDFDLILGSTESALLYYENTGTATAPAFAAGPDIFAPVDPLDAEVGVGVDLDQDGDRDLVTGGYDGLVLFENTGSGSAPVFAEVPGFFAGLAVGSEPVPTFADLDGDCDLDLLVGLSENGVLKYYPNIGTCSAAAFEESQAANWFDIGLYAYPWFVDLDIDGDIDLAAGRDTHGFVYYRNDGDPYAWSWVPDDAIFAGLGGSTYWNSPCLVDLNGNGLADLIYGTAAGPLEYYENAGPPGAPVWHVNTSLFGGVIDVGAASSPFLFDFDADGDLDLASGTQLGDIRYYENVGTEEVPAWHAAHDYFAGIDHSIYSAIALGPLDGDALPDAVVGDLSGDLFYHHNTGTGFTYDPTVFAGIHLGGWSVPRLVDMDGDGDLDLAAGNEAGRLRYFQNVGVDSMAWQEVPNYFGTIDVGSNCSMTLGDYDRDGDMDLLAGNISHELHYYRNDGGIWHEDPTIVAGLVVGQNAAPAFGDLDGDGDLDLTVGNYSGTFNYFENTGDPSRIPENDAFLAEPIRLEAFPNPFRPSVTLRFGLPRAETVDLAIFDAAGRLMRQLIAGPRPAGVQTVTWRRPGASDAGAGSGVYFCRLRVGKTRRTIALTLIR